MSCLRGWRITNIVGSSTNTGLPTRVLDRFWPCDGHRLSLPQWWADRISATSTHKLVDRVVGGVLVGFADGQYDFGSCVAVCPPDIFHGAQGCRGCLNDQGSLQG
jgi:hypothetical protein